MSYVDSQAPSNRRLTGLVIVVVLHAVLGYALVNGLARKIVEVVTQPLETKIIEEIKPPPPDKPPPPPPKLVAPPPPYIPPPEIQVQVPQNLAQTITAITTAKPTAPIAAPGQRVAPAPPRAAARTAPVVDARACDKPEYPAASLRASETGIVQLAFLIDVDGTAVESKVERSSGHRRLDEAARKALSLCKFKPATVDGRPERAWAKIEYEWKLD